MKQLLFSSGHIRADLRIQIITREERNTKVEILLVNLHRFANELLKLVFWKCSLLTRAFTLRAKALGSRAPPLMATRMPFSAMTSIVCRSPSQAVSSYPGCFPFLQFKALLAKLTSASAQVKDAGEDRYVDLEAA